MGHASHTKPRIECILTVDVEDWFHILDIPQAPAEASWHLLPSRIEKNFMSLLDLFSENNTHTTCFFLGWVGERFPHLVQEAARRGHEIASHGYSHRLVYEMERNEFLKDARRSRKLLEDLSGSPVIGYRSAGFSVTDKSTWFFDSLVEAGYRYDSSVFPAARNHGGMQNSKREPNTIAAAHGELQEFPISIADLMGKPMCFFGGGYLRLFPYWLIQRKAQEVLENGRPVVFYVHPREIDPEHPRLPMSMVRRFKSYVNLHTTRSKLKNIVRDFPLTTFRDYMEKQRVNQHEPVLMAGAN